MILMLEILLLNAIVLMEKILDRNVYITLSMQGYILIKYSF